MILRKILTALLVAFLIPIGADGVVKKKRKAASSLTITPRVENSEIGNIKIYQKSYKKKTVDIRIPMAYDYSTDCNRITDRVEYFVGYNYSSDDCPIPKLPVSIKSFLKDKDADPDGLGAGISVAAFIDSDQYIQIRYARFSNGGNSGHLENSFQIIDKQAQKTIFNDDIFQTDSGWSTSFNSVISIINSELSRLNKQSGNIVFDMLEKNADLNYWLDKDGVCFLFGQCEVTACAFGMITIQIPYERLKSVMKPDVYKKASGQSGFKRLPIVKFSNCWNEETFTPYNQ